MGKGYHRPPPREEEATIGGNVVIHTRSPTRSVLDGDRGKGETTLKYKQLDFGRRCRADTAATTEIEQDIYSMPSFHPA